MERTFKTVGHSVYKDTLKLRFTNDPHRQGVLERNGHKEIHLVDLPKEMTKEEAARWILDQNMFTPEVQALAQDVLNKGVKKVDIVTEEPDANKASGNESQRRRVRGEDEGEARPGRPKGSKNRPKQTETQAA